MARTVDSLQLPPGSYKAKILGFGVAPYQYFPSSRPYSAVTRHIAAGTEVQIVEVRDGSPRFYMTLEGDWIKDTAVEPPAGFGAPAR